MGWRPSLGLVGDPALGEAESYELTDWQKSVGFID